MASIATKAATETIIVTNKEIAKAFQFLGKIMELHGENPFKIRSYSNAYLTLRKLDRPLGEIPADELENIKGIGKAISGKIRELLETGRMATLEKYREKTPPGIQELLNVKGFGPKKIKAVWDELGIESAGELLYAVHENRLIDLKGFGKKTQDDLKVKLEYFLHSQNQFHFATLDGVGGPVLEKIRALLPKASVAYTGAMRRCCNTLERLEIMIGYDGPIDLLFDELLINRKLINPQLSDATIEHWPVRVYHFPLREFGSKQFRYTASDSFMEAFMERFPDLDFKGLTTEEDVFSKAGISPIAPEMREEGSIVQQAIDGVLPNLIEAADIKGVLHVHTTASDGLHTLREMAEHARDLGYAYIGITDHSKSAFYANGLQPQRVLEQMAEIDVLNTELAPFKILKGIESDILNDGSLDYEEELLRQFDFIIASVHSNLRMDEQKATERIIKAIENPYTTILGHPTGRLLLARPGYPLDHQKVIDACAANGVAIELNANPHRLDIDWRFLGEAMAKGVRIAVNPDAHSRDGILHIKYGIASARKGGLTREHCLNCLEVDDFMAL